jgi:hypothetical protein
VIVAREAYLIAWTNTTTFIDPVYHTGTTFESIHFTGFYSVPSNKDSFGTAQLLHFAKIIGLESGDNRLALLNLHDSSSTRQILIDGDNVIGVILSVPGAGEYNATLVGPSGKTIHLCVNGTNENRFVIRNGEAFYPVVAECGTNVESSGLSGGAIAAIVVVPVVVIAGIVVGVLVFTGVISFSCLRRGGGEKTGEFIDSKADSPYTTDGI